MPELPEVEIIKRQLNKEIVGFRICDVWYDAPRILKPSAREFVEGVVGKEIVSVRRRAKLLVFVLTERKGRSLRVQKNLVSSIGSVPSVIRGASGNHTDFQESTENGFFLVHLKLSGRLLVRKPKDLLDDYTHVVLELEQGKKKLQLRFAEARKFGYMQYIESEKELEKVLSEFGPEPLNGLTKEEFREILQGTKRKIKEALMDQKVIAGIGNIYANEALWLAKIHPEVSTNSLSASQLSRLFEALGSVLREALEKGGASEQWYRQIHGEGGHYQESFKVYQQADKKCPRCGSKIKRKEVSGRGTFFCPRCQKK